MTQDASRYLALLLTLAVFALAWVAVVEPAITWKREAIDDAARTQANHVRLISGVSALELDHQSIQSAPLQEAIWRSNEGRSLMLDIQSTLAETAQTAGISFSAISPAQSQMDINAEVLALALEFHAPLDAVLEFVQAVESHHPPLIIEAATLRRTQSLQVETDQPVLQASFRVVAVTIAQSEQVTR